MTPILALDVGGTSIKGAIARDREVLARYSVPIQAEQGPEHSFGIVEQMVARMAHECAERFGQPAAVGIAVPGTVDEEAGFCRYSENLGWRELPVRERIEAVSGLPVGFSHDVRTATRAEFALGAGRGLTSMAYLSIGTGLAAGIIVAGRVLVSAGYAGEVGHGGSTEGDLCSCGGRGCAETYASAAAIARQYHAATGEKPDGARDVLERALAGDQAAQAAWDRGMVGIAIAITEIVRVMGTENIVIGGGLVHAGEHLFEPVTRHVDELLTVHRRPILRPAELGHESGMLGAILLAEEALA